jgi:hypothetical protein
VSEHDSDKGLAPLMPLPVIKRATPNINIKQTLIEIEPTGKYHAMLDEKRLAKEEIERKRRELKPISLPEPSDHDLSVQACLTRQKI